MSLKFILIVAFIVTSHILCAQKKVVIIGGGMTGLSAAYHILKIDSTASITIIEKEAKLGGNARTVSVPNKNGQIVTIDAGPQYFTEGPWDEYIDFLKSNNVYDLAKKESMVGSISIRNSKSILITPLDGNYRGEKLTKLLKFRRFNIEANKVFKNPEKWQGKTIENWVNTLPFDSAYQQTIIYPFLAASLGTTTLEIRKTAVDEIVKLFAFRKPKQKDTFSIFEEGMGELIEKIGQSLESEITILRNTSALSVSSSEKTVIIQSEGKKQTIQYDYVIFATHPDQAAKILDSENQFESLRNELLSLKYFEARIVIHNDTNYASPSKPAFLNVITDKNNEVLTNTMNLGMISERCAGIYKSWMTDSEKSKVISNGTFIMEELFYHPLITPEFVSTITKVKEITATLKDISIIGAWSEGLETQNSAVQSGKRATKEYAKWLANQF